MLVIGNWGWEGGTDENPLFLLFSFSRTHTHIILRNNSYLVFPNHLITYLMQFFARRNNNQLEK